MLWVGLVATGVNFTIWAGAFRRLRTVSVSAFQYMIPVVAMVIAAILLGDQPTPLVILGAGLAPCGRCRGAGWLGTLCNVSVSEVAHCRHARSRIRAHGLRTRLRRSGIHRTSA